MKIEIEISVDTDGLCPEDRQRFEYMIQTQIEHVLGYLHPGVACICEYARYKYSKPESIVITGD